MKTKNLKTITGRLIKVTPNKTNRTFTIRTGVAKYRTMRMSKEEFSEALNWTGNDWNQFLEGDEYYRAE